MLGIENKKVSIIIPVYNNEEYIERCIESIRKQIYKNLEILIVDDGSTDNTSKIINKMAADDERIIVFHQKNMGVSQARNIGLEHFTGDYVMFVDGDDYIDANVISVLADKMRDGVEMVIFPFIREYSCKVSAITRLFERPECTLSNEEVKRKIFGRIIGPKYGDTPMKIHLMNALNPCYCKLYSKSIIKSIRFYDIKNVCMEDGLFVLQACDNIKGNVAYTEECLYHYNRYNNTSFLHTYSDNLMKRRWNTYNILLKYVRKEERYSFNINLANRIIFELFNHVWYLSQFNMSLADRIQTAKEMFNAGKYSPYFAKSEIHYLGLPWRIFFNFCQKSKSTEIAMIIELLHFYRKIRRICE